MLNQQRWLKTCLLEHSALCWRHKLLETRPVNKGKFFSIIGALLAVAGAVVFVGFGRAVVTFLLDLVARTLGASDLPPTYDFPWGTMEWASSLGDLRSTALGLGLLLLGLMLMSPALVNRMAGVTGWRHGLGLAAAVMLLVVAAGTLYASWIIASAFGSITISDAADPNMIGEVLPVTIWGIMRILVLLGILALALVAAVSDSCAENDGGRGGRMQMKIALGMLCLFCLCLITLCLGPASHAIALIDASDRVSPDALAADITQSVYLLRFSALFPALAGVLLLVVGLRKRPKLGA